MDIETTPNYDLREIKVSVFVEWNKDSEEWEVGFCPYEGRRVFLTTKNPTELPELMLLSAQRLHIRIETFAERFKSATDNSPSQT